MPLILSVEDDVELQQLISLALRRHGYEVFYAFTGREGYEKALALAPDLIILDMMLPMWNGAEVARQLKKHKATREIPIIVFTAYPDRGEFLEADLRGIGILEYMHKPVRVPDLVALVRNVLERRKPEPVPAAPLAKGALRLNPKLRSVFVDGHLAAVLPELRFNLLAALVSAPGPVPREDLLKRVWDGGGTPAALEKAIQRLREDLGPEGARHLVTSRRGYEITP